MESSPEVTGTIPLLRHKKQNKFKGVRFRSTGGLASIRSANASVASLPKVEPNNFDIARMFQQSRADPREGTLQSYKGHVGEKAKLDFFGNFHKISKIREVNTFERLDPSPNVAFITETERNKIFPQPMGIVRRKGKETEVDLHQYSMGDSYATALSEGLKNVKSVERLNLKSNRLSQSGSIKILETVKPSVIKEINLAENNLGATPVRLLISLLEDRRNQIVKLNLENTGLSAEIVKDLLGVIAYNKHLKYLNLAKNNLKDDIGESLNEMVASNNTLKRLDLHWNGLRSRGGFQLFEGLKHNRYLQMLDISWNAIGKDLNTTTCVAEALEKHQYLMHLDMSYNSFTFEECQVIDGGLRNNHTLLGLHMDGNECFVDSRGFVIPQHFPKLDSGHMAQRIISTSSRHKRVNKPKPGTCWICGEWMEVSFDWKSGESGEVEEEPVYLHLECDGYHHDLLEKVGQGQFQLTRAVPPGDLKFFYSHKEDTMLSDIHPKIRLIDTVEVSFVKWPGFQPTLTASILNHITPQGEICSIKEPFATKPRTPSLMYTPPGIGMEKVPWTIPMSLFKDYVFDTDVSATQDVLMNCFEFDWKTSRIGSLVKDDLQLSAVKEALRGSYPRMCDSHRRDAYKYFSAIGTTNDIFSVGMNSFTDFCNESGIVDGTTFKLADLDLNLKAAGYSDEKNNPLNPPNALVRFKFMEMLVRIAKDKYVRNKLLTDVGEAMQKLLVDHVNGYVAKYDHNLWRRDRYLFEEVDLVYKAYKPVLDSVFHKYSGRYTKPGYKRFMSLEEFSDFCNAAGYINETFAARDTSVCFNMAMMTQIDEIHRRKHLEMSFVEFLEAMGRGLDKANLPPKLSEYSQPQPANAEDGDSSPRMRPEKQDYSTAPLWKKLENAMTYLPQLCSQYQKEPFRPPPYTTFYIYRMPGSESS